MGSYICVPSVYFFCVLRIRAVSGKLYDAWATEGGHSEMAPRDDLEWEFCKVGVTWSLTVMLAVAGRILREKKCLDFCLQRLKLKQTV